MDIMFIRSVEVADKAKTVGVAADQRSVYGGYHLVVVQRSVVLLVKVLMVSLQS